MKIYAVCGRSMVIDNNGLFIFNGEQAIPHLPEPDEKQRAHFVFVLFAKYSALPAFDRNGNLGSDEPVTFSVWGFAPKGVKVKKEWLSRFIRENKDTPPGYIRQKE